MKLIPVIVFLTLSFQFKFLSAKTIVNSISKGDLALLKTVDYKYQNEHGIHIDFNKTIKTALIGSTKSSQGEVWLNKGRMRLEISKPEISKIIAGADYLWIENPPPPGFKDIKTQVMRASLKSNRAKAQGLIQLLTQGGVLKYFKVSGVQKSKGYLTYFLQPESQAIEFKRAQIKVDTNRQEIKELRYWDQIDNETSYDFNSTQFNQKLDTKIFSYKPPADAEVITY